MGIRIVVADREPIGVALTRFKKLVARHGILWEVRRRASFADPTETRRAKRFQKRFKARQATLLAQKAGEQPVGSYAQAAEAFWERRGKP